MKQSKRLYIANYLQFNETRKSDRLAKIKDSDPKTRIQISKVKCEKCYGVFGSDYLLSIHKANEHPVSKYEKVNLVNLVGFSCLGTNSCNCIERRNQFSQIALVVLPRKFKIKPVSIKLALIQSYSRNQRSGISHSNSLMKSKMSNRGTQGVT